MHSQSRFPLVLFFSVLAFLLAAAFISCKTEEETRTVEISSSSTSNTTGPVTCTVQEADYILHYQQKILTDDYGAKYVTKESEGFELAEYEDRSKTKVPNNSDEPIEPVKAGTEFKDLAKDYEGFSYSYAIQVDSTVYIYYTRNTVKYIFYDNSSEVFKVLATRSGTYGLPCAKPNVKINGKLIIQWKTNGDEPFEGIFKEEDMPFYPVLDEEKYGIGTKIGPTTVGDIVFCDGSAASLAEVQTATGDTLATYKEKAVAVIVFTRYNAETGSAIDGDKVIGVGIQALNSAPRSGQEAFKSRFHKEWRQTAENPYYNSYICESYHGYYDMCDIRNLFGSIDSYFWTAIHAAADYGNTLEITGELLDGWYLPNWQELGLLFDSDYKYRATLDAACDALGISHPDPDTDNFWVTASKHNFDDDHIYAAFLNPANSYTPFTTQLNNDEFDDKYWKKLPLNKREGQADKCQILPFREFK